MAVDWARCRARRSCSALSRAARCSLVSVLVLLCRGMTRLLMGGSPYPKANAGRALTACSGVHAVPFRRNFEISKLTTAHEIATAVRNYAQCSWRGDGNPLDSDDLMLADLH